MRLIKKLLIPSFMLASLLTISSCNKKLSIDNYDIIHELEFGGVYIKSTIDDFNKLGFEYGDSVDISFSNGYKLEDQPYYNGYYVDAGETLLVGYPGYDYIKATLNYGDDLWDIAKLEEKDKATVSLNTKGKYKDIQDTMNIQYKDVRSEYDSDVEFANYRNIVVGNIKANKIYRSASPCDNKHNRAHYVDTLISEAKVKYIMNLADTKEKIDSYIAKSDFNSPYFLSLYQSKKLLLMGSNNEKILPLSMNMNYKSDDFREKIALGFTQMASADGPYLVHCLEGKDRTGYVCMVIEALCGATYQQMVDDYMLTYANYYKITLEKDKKRYDIIKARNIDAMLKFIVADENADLTKVDFVPYVKQYLKNGGMTEDRINTLINKLCN